MPHTPITPPPPTTPRQNDGEPTPDVPGPADDPALPPFEAGGATCKAPPPPNAPGNPIFAGTGNKYQREVDYAGPGLLSFVRHYNSGLKTWVHNYMMRVQVSGTTAIAIRPDGKTLAFTGSGVGAWTSNATVTERLTSLSATSAGDPAWRLVTAADTVEIYDASGLPLSVTVRGGRSMRMAYSAGALQSVTDDFGRTLSFGYDTQGRLAAISAPGGETMRYAYGATGHLASVTYADNTSRQYLYENPGLPYALTGLIDQNGVRLATWRYDSQGRAVSTEHAGGVQRYTLSFEPNGLNVLVTDPLGAQRLLQHQSVAGRLVFAGSSQPCPTCTGDAVSTFVNAIGKVTQATDFTGVANQFTYDEARQLLLGSTAAAGRAEAQTRSIVWHTAWRLPTLVTEAGRSTAYGYDNWGNKLSETVTDTATGQARTTQWTYTAQGLVETLTDAKGSTWTYGYDSAGNRTSVKNPLGQQTAYSFDAGGRVTSQTDPNGLVTSYTYDIRGRLLTQTRGGEISSYSYTPAGQLASAAQPDGHQISYGYDPAQRLVAATDNRGRAVQYTLDAMGNRVREEVKDANGNIAQVTARVIDSLNRVVAIQDAHGHTTALAYDANGEPISTTDPLQQTTRQSLDGLRRNVATTFADNSSASQAWSQLGQLAEVTDPKRVKTRYQTDAFGNVVSETSPDIGTFSYERDANGDIVKVTDAKGNAGTITRDALGRPTQIRYDDQTQAFSHDAAGNVARIDDGSGNTVYSRDLQGRVLGKTQTVNDSGSPSRYAVQYAYSGGALAGITYPSGMQVLLRRTAGRVTGIDVQPPSKSGRAQPAVAFVSQLAYTALGAPRSWIWSTGEQAARAFDADGRMTQSEIAGYTYDAAGRVSSITQHLWTRGPKVQGTTNLSQTPVTWSATYDSRNRLTGLSRTGASSTFQYDANSNRLAATETTAGSLDLEAQFDADNITQSASQALNVDAASNRLLGFTQTTLQTSGIASNSVTVPVRYALDANGAMTSDGLRTFVYDASGRMARAEVFKDGEAAGVSYWHNALGQRVFKSEPQAQELLPEETSLDHGFIKWLKATFGWVMPRRQGRSGTLGTAYVYDEEGNLLGEYDNGSAHNKGRTEYIWLPTEQGQAFPVGMFRNGRFYAVHSDHLGTPRLITDADKVPVWQWPYSAFGNNRPTGALSTLTTNGATRLQATTPAVEFNLRFPGQYFDSEANLSYNYYRSYQAGQGRYTQPDPIGLAGGANRYGYVGGDPINLTDPRGLDNPGKGPYGPYWTEPECNYYQTRCTESGGTYYCNAAAQLCKKWPELLRPPGSRPDWTACVRTCLQGKDKQCNQSPANMCDNSGINTSCNVQIHEQCWTQCYSDSR